MIKRISSFLIFACTSQLLCCTYVFAQEKITQPPITIEGTFSGGKPPNSGKTGACEGDCTDSKTKEKPNTPAPQQKTNINKGKQIENLAGQIFGIYDSYSNAVVAINYILGKYIYEIGLRALYIPVSFVVDFILNPGEIEGKDIEDKRLQEFKYKKLMEEFEKIQKNSKEKDGERKLNNKDLPTGIKYPEYIDAHEREEKARALYFRNKSLSQEDAIKEIEKFFSQTMPEQTGKFLIDVIKKYSLENVEFNGITQEELDWYKKFIAFGRESDDALTKKLKGNTCITPYGRCPMIIAIPENSSCMCSSSPGIPGAPGYASAEPVSMICEVPNGFCLLQNKIPIELGCSCMTPYGPLSGKVGR